MMRRRRFRSDVRGASAIEFSLVAMPFIMLLIGILQLSIYFMTQSALDSGVVQTADYLVNTYYSNSAPPTITPASLKAMVIAKSGGLIANASALAVDMRLLTVLDLGVTPIGNSVDPNVPGSIMVLRAQASVASVVPGMGILAVQSTALVRRQGL
jgi:Flp pilus assembly protein TadG